MKITYYSFTCHSAGLSHMDLTLAVSHIQWTVIWRIIESSIECLISNVKSCFKVYHSALWTHCIFHSSQWYSSTFRPVPIIILPLLPLSLPTLLRRNCSMKNDSLSPWRPTTATMMTWEQQWERWWAWTKKHLFLYIRNISKGSSLVRQHSYPLMIREMFSVESQPLDNW